jgi:HSP20 family protein
MVYRGFYPSGWEDFERMQRRMSRLFNEISRNSYQSAPCFPAVNIWANEEGQVVTAELPGVEMKNIEISVVGDMLTINGTRDAAEDSGEEQENTRTHRQERDCGDFSRTIQLPHPVDMDKVEAVLDKGVLSITLPRAEADRPKKIMVKSVS